MSINAQKRIQNNFLYVQVYLWFLASFSVCLIAAHLGEMTVERESSERHSPEARLQS